MRMSEARSGDQKLNDHLLGVHPYQYHRLACLAMLSAFLAPYTPRR